MRDPSSSHDETSVGARSPFTLKGLAVGAVLSLAIGWIGPYGYMLNYFLLGFNPSSPGAIFFFLLLTLGINVMLGVVRRRFALSRADLILIYCMLLMAVTVPTWGLLFFLVGTMVYPFYFATPENNFTNLLHDHIPTWIAPQSESAITGFYEGLPAGASIPWEVWFEPLTWWFVLFLAMSFMLICASTILHRQWSVHERLTYPMAQLPLRMIEEGEGALAPMSPLFRSAVMWMGCAVPVICFSFAALHHFYPAVPDFPFFHPGISWFRHTVTLVFAFSFAWVGFFYLVNLNIIFSIWFFYLLSKVQEGIFGILGIASTEKLSLYEYSQPADLTHQATGAVLVLVLYALWAGRGHLGEVVRRAWDPHAGVDDSEELLSYRVAATGFVVANAIICIWLWRSGVPVVVIPILLGVSLLFFILVARVVATAGVATTRSPIVPAYFVISALGTSLLGAKGLVALNFSFVWQGESRTSPMVAATNGLKLAESVRGPKGRLFWGMMIALVCSFAAGVHTILDLSYAYGALNLTGINWAGAHGWPNMVRTITDMPGPDLRGWLFKGIGATVEGFLLWATHRWLWWPLHPIGFAIAVGWLTGHIWFSALVCWILKATILHYGGPSRFHNLKPFFLGLILGECIVAGGWGLIYWITGDLGRILTAM
jgi:hypothetical protein